MAQKPDGKAAKTERVTFTRPAADRIAKAVRTVEAGDRKGAPLIIPGRISASSKSGEALIRTGKIPGPWSKNSLLGYIWLYEGGVPPYEVGGAEQLAPVVNKFHNFDGGEFVVVAKAANGYWYIVAADKCCQETTPCSSCNEAGEDLLPQTITVTFNFPATSASELREKCYSLLDGQTMVLTRQGNCSYALPICCNSASVATLTFAGLGQPLTLQVLAEPCNLTIATTTNATDCFIEETEFEFTIAEGEALTLTITPGGTAGEEDFLKWEGFPATLEITYGYDGTTVSETNNGNCAGSPRWRGCDAECQKGIYASHNFNTNELLEVWLSLIPCPAFMWSFNFTAGDHRFYTAESSAAVRSISWSGSLASLEVPTLQDFIDANALVPTFHEVRILPRYGSGYSSSDFVFGTELMLSPFASWPQEDKDRWNFGVTNFAPGLTIEAAQDAPLPEFTIDNIAW